MSETLVLPPSAIRFSLRRPPTPSMALVLENTDLLSLILASGKLSPASFVAASRVSRAWHGVCMCDGSLALQAARGAQYLTKRLIMGLLAINSEEANRLPRQVRNRYQGGFMYLYPAAAVEEAWGEMVGGHEEWRVRIAQRAREQRGIEEVFGPHWRQLQWPRGPVGDGRAFCPLG